MIAVEALNSEAKTVLLNGKERSRIADKEKTNKSSSLFKRASANLESQARAGRLGKINHSYSPLKR